MELLADRSVAENSQHCVLPTSLARFLLKPKDISQISSNLLEGTANELLNRLLLDGNRWRWNSVSYFPGDLHMMILTNMRVLSRIPGNLAIKQQIERPCAMELLVFPTTLPNVYLHILSAMQLSWEIYQK